MSEFQNDDPDYEDQDSDSDLIRKLRKQLRTQSAKLKEAEPELTELREFKKSIAEKERLETVAAAAKEIGLSDKQALLFAKLNPDVEPTKEAIASFAVEYEIAPPSVDARALAETNDKPFLPISVGGTAPINQKYTREQWVALEANNPEEYLAAFKEGRVDGLAKR